MVIIIWSIVATLLGLIGWYRYLSLHKEYENVEENWLAVSDLYSNSVSAHNETNKVLEQLKEEHTTLQEKYTKLADRDEKGRFKK